MADVLIARVSYGVLITRVLITRVDCNQRNSSIFWKTVPMTHVLITRVLYNVLITRVLITRVDCTHIQISFTIVVTQIIIVF